MLNVKASLDILDGYDTAEIKHSLAQYPDAIKAQKASVRNFYNQFRDSEAERALAEAELIVEIANEVNPTTGKPLYSNDGARKAELMKRQNTDATYRRLAEFTRKMENLYLAAQDELEALCEKLKSYRYIARLVSAELELMASEVEEIEEHTVDAKRKDLPLCTVDGGKEAY